MDAVIARALCKNKTQRYASTRELAQAVITAYGLTGKVEDWAERPQDEIDAAIASALPTERPPAPSTAPAAVALPRPSSSSSRDDATLPKVALDDGGDAPAIATGPTPAVWALIALGVAVAGTLVMLLFR
jgi:hypothetical protein